MMKMIFIAFFLVFLFVPTLKITAASYRGERCLVDESALQDLKRQKIKLKKQNEALKERENELLEKERALKEEFSKIEEIRKEIKEATTEVSKNNETKISKMIETFEKMSARKAAKIISKLDDELGVAAITQISTPKLAKILGAMDPQTSSRLTELMALGRTQIKKEKEGGKLSNGIDG